ncbi:hypothetical protein PVAND_013209 [Polypedilum vanderplanki]|uniref:Uncharacterized protein n=1 Tax=Polypedilum vanderplanki TaxID=319348 RepID=A0A9J6CNT4_POLVA|nr:hypothetical protein PVAND_013209 [Polypedilum vanderplanki]
MKFSIFILAFFIASVTSSPVKIQLKTLYQRTWDVIYSSDDDDFKILRNSNQNCIRRKFKMDENGNKFVNEDLGTLAFTTVVILCLSDADKAKVEGFEKKLQLIRTVRGYLDSEINCIKNKLHRVEPTSELLKGFTPSNNPEEQCESFEYIEAALSQEFNELKENISKFGLQSCAALDEYETKIKVKSFKLAIVALNRPPVQSEINKLKQEFESDGVIFNEKLYQCILKELIE